ncbi:MAG: peptide deformylase [Chlorobiota bacterium]|jgi:peptide deformylase|nr:peptide deformylase [Chlorobiota bacterium]QQS67264.1 MAG: peptide deformylase [Chlorobiota bacterium]
MVLPIYLYDHPILRKKLSLVENINDELVSLIENMHLTMEAAEGIGLASNQVGQDYRLITVDLRGIKDHENFKPLTLINPIINAFSEEKEKYDEGCLSLPDLRADVIRPIEIEVSFYDENMIEKSINANEILARVIQHEVDHLNGIYFFDHLSTVKRSLLKRKLLEIKRGYIDTDYLIYN